MKLRINGTDVSIIGKTLVNPPSLLEDRTDTFEFAAKNFRPDLLIDGHSIPGERDIADETLVRWTWEKGPRGRVGFAEYLLGVGEETIARGILRIEPRKLSLEEYTQMLDEIAKTAYNIVYDLRDSTFAYVDLAEPEKVAKTGLEWIETIRSFLTPLSTVLEDINKQPHIRIREEEEDKFIWEVKRPGPGLIRRIMRASDRDLVPDARGWVRTLSTRLGGRVPMRLPSLAHLSDTNTYENQLILDFLKAVEHRLRSILSRAVPPLYGDLIRRLLRNLEHLQSLPFLRGASPLRQPPRPTLVLLRNFKYRQFFEIFRRFHWGLRIRQANPAWEDFHRLTTQHVDETYQVWTFLKLVTALQQCRLGRIIEAQGLVELLGFDELRVRVEPGARVTVKMPDSNVFFLTYKPHFGEYASPDKPYSVSFSKDPDMTVRVAGKDAILVFDAKYRLDSETPSEAVSGPSEPKPEDINKMHVYRDAIRICVDRRPYVLGAYALYPGSKKVLYDNDKLGAIPLRPGARLDDLASLLMSSVSPLS
jgi:hypothetical protein